jgi:non-specific serine/threonine protein kinase
VTVRGEVRFRVLETIREYALEQLERSAEAISIRGAHAEYFLSMAEAAHRELRGPPSVVWLDRLEAEHDNLRAVVRWAVENRNAELALRLSAALQRYLDARGHASEGQRWLGSALGLDAPASAAARAGALHVAGRLAWLHGEYPRAAALHEESLCLYESIGDEAGVAQAQQNLGNVAHYQKDYKRAAGLYERSLALYRRLGDGLGAAGVLNSLGVLARNRNELESASSLLEESLAIFRRLGDSRNVALLLSNIARVARDQGDWVRAADLCTEGLAVFSELSDAWGVATVLVNLGIVEQHSGNPRRAARLFGAAESLREESTGSSFLSLSPAELERYEASARATRLRLGEKVFATQWRAGRCLSFLEAVAEGLGAKPAHAARPDSASTRDRGSTAHLTSREQQVAWLVAEDKTNREIAQALVIAVGTAERHVSNILSKLKIRSRADIAAWVAEARLSALTR